jgi:hypothetical protein
MITHFRQQGSSPCIWHLAVPLVRAILVTHCEDDDLIIFFGRILLRLWDNIKANWLSVSAGKKQQDKERMKAGVMHIISLKKLKGWMLRILRNTTRKKVKRSSSWNVTNRSSSMESLTIGYAHDSHNNVMFIMSVMCMTALMTETALMCTTTLMLCP